MSVKNSNDSIANRNRDLPACSAVCVCVYVSVVYRHSDAEASSKWARLAIFSTAMRLPAKSLVFCPSPTHVTPTLPLSATGPILQRRVELQFIGPPVLLALFLSLPSSILNYTWLRPFPLYLPYLSFLLPPSLFETFFSL